jgi:hypothetical protein
MKPKKMYSRTKPDDIQYLTADGKQVTARDEDFQRTLSALEHDGIDSDVIYMARPLLEGSARQQAVVTKFLNRIRSNFVESKDAQMQLVRLLASEGVTMGHVPNHSVDEFVDAWKEASGDPGSHRESEWSIPSSDDPRSG